MITLVKIFSAKVTLFFVQKSNLLNFFLVAVIFCLGADSNKLIMIVINCDEVLKIIFIFSRFHTFVLSFISN
jgi:hypothetical protein